MQMYKCHPLRQLLSWKRTIAATTSNLCTYINSRQRNINTLSVSTKPITTPKCFYTSASSSTSSSSSLLSAAFNKESNTGVSSVAKGKNMKAYNVINDEFFKVGSNSLSNNTTQKEAGTANAPHKINVAKPTSVTVNTKSSNKAKWPSASSPSNSSNTVSNSINNNNNAVDSLSRRVVKLVERTTQLERRVNGHDEKIALVQGQQTILEQRIGSNEEVINNLANDVAHSVQLTSNMMMTQQNMDGLIAQVEQRVMGVNDTVRNLENTMVQLKSENNDDNANGTITTNTDNNNNIMNNDINERCEMQEEHIETNVDNNIDARDVGLESIKANYKADVNEVDEFENEELSDNQRKSVITLIQVMLAEELRKLNLAKKSNKNNNLEETENEEMETTTEITSIKKDDEVDNTSNEKNVEQEEVNEENNKGFVHKPEDQSSFSSVNQSNTEYITNLPTLSMFTKLEDNLRSLTTRLQLLEARLNQMVMEKLIVDRVSQYALSAQQQQQQQQKPEQCLYSESVGNAVHNTVYSHNTNNINNDKITKENKNAQNTATPSPSSAFPSETSHNDKVENAINTRLHIDDQWFEELEEEEEEKQAHLGETSTNIESNETSSHNDTHDRYNDFKYKLRVLLRNAGAFPFKDADGCTRIVSEKIVLRHVPVNWGAAEVRNLCVRCCQASNKNNYNNNKNNVIDEIGIVSCIVRRAPLPHLDASHINDKTTTTISCNANNNNEKNSSFNNNIAKKDDDNEVNSNTVVRHAEFKYRSECLDSNETTLHKENSTNKETASSSESSTESTNYYRNTFVNTDMGYGSDDEKYERAFEITFTSAQHALNALLALNRCTLNDKHTQHQQKKASGRSNTSNMPEWQRTSSGQRVLAEPVISADILEVLRHLQEKE